MTATDARSHCDRSTIASVVRNGAPAGDIARWNPTCRADWRERHLGDIYAGSVGREARSDVQIRCSIDGTRYLLLSHVLRHSDTRTGDRTSGHVGSRPLSVCNTSPPQAQRFAKFHDVATTLSRGNAGHPRRRRRGARPSAVGSTALPHEPAMRSGGAPLLCPPPARRRALSSRS